jgi:hypothetical protein
MSMEKSKTREEKSPKKKTYVKPSFQHEKVFETMALSCGKLSATQAQCSHNKKLS